jgi:hypothetical protein
MLIVVVIVGGEELVELSTLFRIRENVRRFRLRNNVGTFIMATIRFVLGLPNDMALSSISNHCIAAAEQEETEAIQIKLFGGGRAKTKRGSTTSRCRN